MGKFKQFLRRTPILAGFATIHKNDLSDKYLSIKPLKSILRVGFSTIHQKDDSDKYLPKENIKESIDLSSHYHQVFLNREKQQEDKLKKIRGDDIFKYNGAIHQLDQETFPHHIKKNLAEYDKIPKHKNPEHPLTTYTKGSADLNSHLIKKYINKNYKHEYKSEENRLNNFHKHLSKHTNHNSLALHHSTIVHSGVGERMGSILSQTKIGDKMHFPAYTSTSTHYPVAKDFSKYGINNERHVIHFHLPKGYTKARYIANIAKYPTEHEVLLHHGQTFKKVGEHKESHPGNNFEEIHHHHFVPA